MNTKTLRKVCVMILIMLCIGSVSQLFAQTKIMCLGDSITGSPGCWRALLWQKLTNNGYTNIDFVGTQYPQGCGFTYDGEHEGHGGILATGIADGNQLPPWLSATNPDIILMFLGTNDCWSSKGNTAILAAFTTMVSQMRANNANMKILVAQITPLEPDGCTACPTNVTTLNAAIPAWASGLSTSQSPITVVDQWTGFDTATDTDDGCHPNDLGIVKICDKWYPALITYLSGGTVTLEPTAMVTVAPDTPAPTDAPTAEPVTLAPTDSPTDTSAPTVTPAPTSIPTATPVGVTDAPTDTPTDAPIVTDGPASTDPLPTLPSSDCTCTCPNLCSSTTAITIPFTFDGAGEFCWTTSSLGTYINSWNSDSVNIDGISCTNTYVLSSTIPPICGVYYIYYKSTYPWSHIEIK